jgi:hypothetical protein
LPSTPAWPPKTTAPPSPLPRPGAPSTQKREASQQTNTLTPRYGTLRLNELTLRAPEALKGKTVEVQVEDSAMNDVKTQWSDTGALALSFTHPINLRQDQTLQVTIA